MLHIFGTTEFGYQAVVLRAQVNCYGNTVNVIIGRNVGLLLFNS